MIPHYDVDAYGVIRALIKYIRRLQKGDPPQITQFAVWIYNLYRPILMDLSAL